MEWNFLLWRWDWIFAITVKVLIEFSVLYKKLPHLRMLNMQEFTTKYYVH